ncbi:IclR family transcriptional regulator [Brevibacillus fulvus]|uniref:DNA-binding IclR family transcriptional regulator n=1 Tax=Brevibacillus fulvus TaxID=1125967 RepID=A0A938XSG9_9BACL|nr:IclR family transcriptional regulator [Brevibacillus fulvus]MBM7589117.1 DNA-binding IclR family transcriptional regulator [Brevibacillus fulvus]
MREVNMGSIRSIDRAIDVLQAFTIEKPVLTVDEIAKMTKIPHSTVYRILCTLERRRLVQFEEKLTAYKPGLGLMQFSSLISSTFDIRQVAEELLLELHAKTNQTVLMAVEDGDEIIYIYNKETYEGLKFSSVQGQRRPFIYGVLGPVLLAFFSESRIEHILKIPVSRHTPYRVTDKEVIRQRLQQIKQDRIYVESNETNIGVTGIGAPVFGSNGEIIAAIGLIGPAVYMDNQLDNLKALVAETADKISRKIGYQASPRGK